MSTSRMGPGAGSPKTRDCSVWAGEWRAWNRVGRWKKPAWEESRGAKPSCVRSSRPSSSSRKTSVWEGFAKYGSMPPHIDCETNEGETSDSKPQRSIHITRVRKSHITTNELGTGRCTAVHMRSNKVCGSNGLQGGGRKWKFQGRTCGSQDGMRKVVVKRNGRGAGLVFWERRGTDVSFLLSRSMDDERNHHWFLKETCRDGIVRNRNQCDGQARTNQNTQTTETPTHLEQ